MTSIKLFYHPTCADCAKKANITKRLDWLGRVDLSTETPPTGALEIGDIAVYDYQSQQYFTGIYAVRKVSMQVPAYYIYGLLLYIPFIRNLAGKNKVGCNGTYCEVPVTNR